MCMRSCGYFNDVRKLNKERLLEFIREHTDKDIDEVLGIFSLNSGLSVATLKIYVNELRLAKQINEVMV